MISEDEYNISLRCDEYKIGYLVDVLSQFPKKLYFNGYGEIITEIEKGAGGVIVLPLETLKKLYKEFVFVKNNMSVRDKHFVDCGIYLSKILTDFDMENEMKPTYTRCNRGTVSYLLACIQSTFGSAVREYGDLQGQLTGDGVLYTQICVEDLDDLVEDYAYIRSKGFTINNEQTFVRAGDYVTNLVNITRTQSKTKPFDMKEIMNKTVKADVAKLKALTFGIIGTLYADWDDQQKKEHPIFLLNYDLRNSDEDFIKVDTNTLTQIYVDYDVISMGSHPINRLEDFHRNGNYVKKLIKANAAPTFEDELNALMVKHKVADGCSLSESALTGFTVQTIKQLKDMWVETQ